VIRRPVPLRRKGWLLPSHHVEYEGLYAAPERLFIQLRWLGFRDVAGHPRLVKYSHRGKEMLNDTTRLGALAVTGCLFLILGGCGSSDSDGDDPSGESSSQNSGEMEAPSPPNGQGGSVTTDVTGRKAAIAALLSLPVLNSHKTLIEASSPAKIGAGAVSCESGGTMVITVTDDDATLGNAGDSISTEFRDCRQQFGGVEQAVSGDLLTKYNAEGSLVSARSLQLGRSGMDGANVKDVSAELKDGAFTARFDADFPSLNLTNVKVETLHSIQGEDLSCPEDGALMLTATDGSKVVLEFAPGGNMLLTIPNLSETTIACSEVKAGMGTPSESGSGGASGSDGDGGGLTPPPAPGG